MKTLWQKLKNKLKEEEAYRMDKVAQRINITFLQFFRKDEYMALFKDEIGIMGQNRKTESPFIEYNDLTPPSNTFDGKFVLILRFQIHVLDTGEKIE
jgi:hypothetical protein